MPVSLAEVARGRALVRAELACASWEIFSALLFASAVLPAALGSPASGIAFLASLVASALALPALLRRGSTGLGAASGARVVAWIVSLVPVALPVRGDVRPWVATLAFGLMAGAMRRAIYGRTLEAPPDWTSTNGSMLAGWLRQRLSESAVLAGVIGGHLLLLFGVAFLRAESRVIFQGWWEFVPILGSTGTALYTAVVARWTQRTSRVLDAGPDADAASVAAARAELRRLPPRLSRVNFVIWAACAIPGVFYFRTGPTFGGVDAFMQSSVAALFSIGVAYYQRGWDHDTVRALDAIVAAHVGPYLETDTPRGLRERMLREFGGPIAFASALMMLSSLGLYRTLSEAGRLESEGAQVLALVTAFVMLTLAIGGVILRVASDLSTPIASVASAAENVASGALAAPVPEVEGPLEIARLGASVERMRQALARTISELEREQSTLESKVDERTAELSRALVELRDAQAALVQGERLASIGELVANVAHEIRNPLNAVVGSAEPLEGVVTDVRAMLDAYRSAEAELPPARRAELAALRERLELDASLEDLSGISAVIQRASARTARIVQALSGFAHRSTEAVPSDLEGALAETLELLVGRLRDAGIEVVLEGEALPPVTCRVGEIAQVFMNLIQNAAHALEGVGAGAVSPTSSRRIGIHRSVEGTEAVVRIRDHGPGVPESIRERLFEPFTTTKPVGQGTGLGLSICRDIVRRHGGRLTLETPPNGAGACFVLRLPLLGPRAASAPESVRGIASTRGTSRASSAEVVSERGRSL